MDDERMWNKTKEYLNKVGTDIPETLKRAGLEGTIPRSRFITLLSLLEMLSKTSKYKKSRKAYKDAYNLLKLTIIFRNKENE